MEEVASLPWEGFPFIGVSGIPIPWGGVILSPLPLEGDAHFCTEYAELKTSVRPIPSGFANLTFLTRMG